MEADLLNANESLEASKIILKSMHAVLDIHQIKVKFNSSIFLEVLQKTQHDLKIMKQDMDNNTPNAYKQYGVFAYWIKRLKPFDERSTKYGNYTNETIAMTFVIFKINQFVPSNKKVTVIPDEFLNLMLYLIRFEQISKYGMIMLLSSIFETK